METVFLGLDGGGTQTRWALCDAPGNVLASGALEPLATLRLDEPAALAQARDQMQALATQIGTRLPTAAVAAVVAGMSGIGTPQDPAAQRLLLLLSQALGVAANDILVTSDIALAHACAFAPGAGYLIYAGTGSVAAFVDDQGQLHRAGGRGGILDDGGSGYWIAREALRHIWRQEDERPGSWEFCPLAMRVFAAVGGSDWARTRALVYGGTRGAMGEVALAVAAAASDDLVARQLLQRAGQELARLGWALQRRFGPRPMVLAGRVWALHPAILESLRATLGPGQAVQVLQAQAQVEAARWAARNYEKKGAR